MIDIVMQNKEFIGIVIAILTVFIPLWTLLITKSKEQKQLNFERFHKSVMTGISNVDSGHPIGLDAQVALLFELRNYSEYYPVISRLLEYNIARWSKEKHNSAQFKLLINEAKQTQKYITKNYLSRFFNKSSWKWKLPK